MIIEFCVGHKLARSAPPLAKPGNNRLDLLQSPVHHCQGVIRATRHTSDVSLAAAHEDCSYRQQRLSRIAGQNLQILVSQQAHGTDHDDRILMEQRTHFIDDRKLHVDLTLTPVNGNALHVPHADATHTHRRSDFQPLAVIKLCA